MFFFVLNVFLLFVTLTKSQNTLNFTNITDILINENVTSNYYFAKFNFGYKNITLPFAIGHCSAYNTKNNYFKAECLSNKLLNVTYYSQKGCSSQNYIGQAFVNDTKTFRCNASNDYASLLINVGTACPGIFELVVAINVCHSTGDTYANILCKNNYLQYVYYSDDACSEKSFMAVNDANKTCDQFFTVQNVDVYGSVQQCVTNLTLSTYNVTSFATTQRSQVNTTILAVNTTKIFLNNTTRQPLTNTTLVIIKTSHSASVEPSTTHRGRIIPGTPTIVRSGVSSIFNINVFFVVLASLIISISC